MTRCSVCKKKIKSAFVDVFKCRCSQYLCKYHRFPEQHGCSFDYIQVNKEKLKSQMVQVESEKVLKI